MNRLNWVILIILFGGFSGCSVYIDDFDVDEDGTSQNDALTGSDPANTPASGIIDCNHEVVLPSGNGLPFCEIQSGSFEMGCDPEKESCQDNELPLHTVNITSFKIQQFEVTNGVFQEFVAAEPAWAPDGEQATNQCDSAYYLKSWRDGAPSDGLLKPVLGVCWYAADAFCQWLGQGFRLPTEAEWERVARGTEDGTDSQEYRVYPFSTLDCSSANYNGCENGPADVGSRSGTAFGQVFDMGGNAWELVADWYGDRYYCDPLNEGYTPSEACNTDFAWTDPTGPESGDSKVVRGGSWFHEADWMRNAKRERVAPDFSSNIAGFRCASD